MQIADCAACQHGFHDEHVRDWKPIPPGVMGGARCECKGDCAHRNGDGQLDHLLNAVGLARHEGEGGDDAH